MLVLCLIVLLFSLIGVKIRKDNSYVDFPERSQTLIVTGICSLFIVISHISGEIEVSEYYRAFQVGMGQFAVVPFLFFSGYGIAYSINNKPGYIKSFPKKRFLKLYCEFAIITLIYILVNVLCGNYYSPLHILLSFTGFTSIGNGGWFMFATFELYILVILFFREKINKWVSLALMLGAVFILTVAEYLLHFETCFYNTLIFFPLGMIFFNLKSFIPLPKNKFLYATVLVLLTAAFCFLVPYKRTVVLYPLWCMIGMLVILLVMQKITFNSKILKWVGQHAFEFFMLQYIPIKIGKSLSLNQNSVIFTAFVIIITILLTIAFSKTKEIIENRIREPKQN